MTVLTFALLILLLVSSGALVLLVLLHKGKGGGLSSMFGGGMSSVASGSSVAEKNLTRITIGVGVVWFASIIAYGLIIRALL
ncbi:preprotein translocase subunit SecG [Glycomyces salinus]|uniref:preprotein translocase subunit SecG n=1 Tax=Glycomyces salinus TaxID=980294 RepID=UPI0018EAE576|nr:preprotein translocase subunit SecG [Glycomyces salinus]